MRPGRGLVGATLVVAVLLAPLASLAHQQQEAITRVLFNPRTGNIEVMHRFLLHDAEHAVQVLFDDGGADIFRDASVRERFAAYVHERFSLADEEGRTLPLTPVGQEIDGKFLWVYAETAIPAALESLTITHSALHDIWPEQVNLVNVERGGAVDSALFTGGRTEVTVELR